MPIAIVSALPKSAPTPATDAAATAEGASPVQDFTSLLLGQLAAVRPDAGLIPGTAPESAANDSGDANPDDEYAEASDPLALLAALAQAPFEQRVEVTSPGYQAPQQVAAGITAHGSPTDESAAATGRTTPDTPPALSADRAPVPANEAAAKFAVFPDTSASTPQEPVALSTVAATAATGVHARQEDASPALPVPTPLHDRDWHNDFAQKVTWIATGHKQSAELTLNPPSMGSIQISLKLDNDTATATATFVSSNAEVRETIETALPRLREMLAGAGIELGQAQVSAESFRQAANNGRGTGESASQSGNDMAILAPDPQAARTTVTALGAGRGLVDTFV